MTDVDCAIAGMSEPGAVTVTLGDGQTRTIRLHGVVVPAGAAGAAAEVVSRLVRQRARYRPVDDAAGTARLRYLAWVDKSGDVWRDVAELLLAEGAARVADGDFPERAAYLRAERQARERGAGL